jgi:site-specific recombinase XerD
MTRTDRVLTAWQLQMRAEGLADRTITERRRIIERAAAAMDCEALDMTTPGILAWLASLTRANTRGTYYSALRAWHLWLTRVGHRDDNPMALIKAPRVPRRVPRPVANAHLEQLLGSRMHRRTRVMVHLAAYLGLRVHEVAAVRGEDVDLLAYTIRVRGKGGTDDLLPLHPEVVADARTMPRTGWWFPSPKHADDHIAATSVSDILSRAMRRAEVPGTAHQLRHWFGTELVRSGTDVRVVQELMRHASLATTAIYVAVDDGQRRDAVHRLPVLQPRASQRAPEVAAA